MTERIPGRKVVLVLGGIVVVVVVATMALWWTMRPLRRQAREALRRDLAAERAARGAAQRLPDASVR